MDKINNVSFTGLKNVGCFVFQDSPTSFRNALSAIITDDAKGQDVVEFRKVVDKVAQKSENFMNNRNYNLLNIETHISPESRTLYLNNKPVKVNDENLPIFSYLAKLTKRIANMPKKDIIIEGDYVNLATPDNLVSDRRIIFKGYEDYWNYTGIYDNYFEPDTVQPFAKQFNKFIQEKMNKYFGL